VNEISKLGERISVTHPDVSKDRVEAFLEDYLKSRRGIGATERIFQHFSAYKESEQENDNEAFGFNVVLRKGPLVEGSNWFPMRGWEFAVAEERRLLTKLESELRACVEDTGRVEAAEVGREPVQILEKADRLSDFLKDAGYAPGLVVLATSVPTEAMIELTKQLEVPDWDLPPDLRSNWILGRHRGKLILYHKDAALDRLYAVDVRRFGRLVQFAPRVELAIQKVDPAAALQQDTLDYEDKIHLRLYQSYEIQRLDCEAIWAANIEPPD